MSIKLGLYDFFAFTIPGGLYILVINHLFTIFGWIRVDFRFFNGLPVLQIFVLAVLAFIAGLLIDPVAQRWGRLFKPRGIAKKAYAEFAERYSHLEIKFQPEHWGVLLACIRRDNAEVGTVIERHNVMSTMLGNLSLGLAFLAALQIVEFMLVKFLTVHFVLFATFAALSLIAIRESAKFQLWFYLSIFDAVAARSLEISDLISLKQQHLPDADILEGKKK
jgi:hypothetical protein